MTHQLKKLILLIGSGIGTIAFYFVGPDLVFALFAAIFVATIMFDLP